VKINNNYQGILVFLGTKDDSLLLHTGALLHACLSHPQAAQIKERLPILFGGNHPTEG
jgi:hypothetical protein